MQTGPCQNCAQSSISADSSRFNRRWLARAFDWKYGSCSSANSVRVKSFKKLLACAGSRLNAELHSAQYKFDANNLSLPRTYRGVPLCKTGEEKAMVGYQNWLVDVLGLPCDSEWISKSAKISSLKVGCTRSAPRTHVLMSSQAAPAG